MNSVLDIGPKLVVARRAQGMSQRELGSRLGVHQQQVARWEATAYRCASLERVSAAAATLGLEVATPCGQGLLLAAESAAIYGSANVAAVAPVRDLGEIAARIRADAEVLAGQYGFGRIGVFGSFARGEQASDSDVDLLVEFAEPDKVMGLRFMQAADHIEDILGRRVDVARPHLLKERLRPRVMEDLVYVWSA